MRKASLYSHQPGYTEMVGRILRKNMLGYPQDHRMVPAYAKLLGPKKTLDHTNLIIAHTSWHVLRHRMPEASVAWPHHPFHNIPLLHVIVSTHHYLVTEKCVASICVYLSRDE